MGRARGILGVGCSVALCVWAAGCSGSKVKPVNVAAGEYHSEEDQAALSRSEKSAYCAALTKELTGAQQAFQQKQKEIQDAKNLTQSIRQQIVPIEQEVLKLESDIRSVNDKIAAVKALPRTYKIRPGDWLSLIAMQKTVYNDVDKWLRIFEANRDKIEDPYYIFADTVLVIPRDWPVD